MSKQQVVIIGGGPYALATARSLKTRDVDALVFGELMGFWRSMPRGMYLRSILKCSSIGAPDPPLSLFEFARAHDMALPSPLPLDTFLKYGRWYAENAGIHVDPRLVRSVAQNGSGFRVQLEDGDEVAASNVVVAAGIRDFAWRPPEFDDLPPSLASHSADHSDFGALAGKKVLVIGAGQSALESAALLREQGADVEVVARAERVVYLRGESVYRHAALLRPLLYPSRGVGPPGLNWIMGTPGAYRALPAGLRSDLAYRATRPAGAGWLRPRLEGVPIVLGRSVSEISPNGGSVRLELNDGSSRAVDHVLLATGYRVDAGRYPFLDDKIVGRLRRQNGLPVLEKTFESSVGGLFFVGAPAAASAGPGMRFVSHSGMAARAVAGGVAARVA